MKTPKSLITSIPFSTRNKLKTSEDIRELESCKKLSVLDISYNSLEEPEVLEVLAKMPELHVLTSTGNPIIRKTRDYRRNVLYRRVCKKKSSELLNICILEIQRMGSCRCVHMTYMDQRPVSERDRLCIAAWAVRT